MAPTSFRRRFLLAWGWLSLATFLATGSYMHFVHGHLAEFELAERMFYRSRHIYILAAALIQLGVGCYVVVPAQRSARRLQVLGTGLLVIATPLLLAAFWFEARFASLRSPLSAFGLYALVGGVMAHLMVGWKSNDT